MCGVYFSTTLSRLENRNYSLLFSVSITKHIVKFNIHHFLLSSVMPGTQQKRELRTMKEQGGWVGGKEKRREWFQLTLLNEEVTAARDVHLEMKGFHQVTRLET